MSDIPIGYFISVLFLAWCTYFVIAPTNWPRPFRFLRIYFEIVNEVTFLALFWLIGLTTLAFSDGTITHPLGKLTFGIALAVAIGLLIITYRGLQASPIVNRALDDSLDEGWRDSLSISVQKKLQKSFTAKALLGPLFWRPITVKRVANIRYGDAGKRNLLDVYHPRSLSPDSPVLIHFHGGSFVSGRKNSQSLPLLYGLASNGWVCISANYRIGRDVTFPDHLIDAKKIIAWVREHAEEYGVDPSTIFLAGNSAGAHLAAMGGLTPNDSRFQPGFENTDTKITGVICLAGYYGPIAKKIDSPSSPMAYSGKNAPPFFVVHGDKDSTVPVEQARHFVNGLRKEAGSPIIYAELPYASHIFDLFHSLRSEAVFHGIQAFTTWVLSNQESLSKDDSQMK